MEQYEIEKNQGTPTINYGYFEQKVFDKHVKAYGTDGAQKNLTTATKILGNALIQKENSSLSNNVLLIGKVQSGKTSNLEMLSALMFDNGFNLLIIYGGYDGTLLGQCNDRFSGTFDVDDDDNAPLLISTENAEDLNSFNEDFFQSNIEDNRPIIITSMKRPNALNKVNEVLKGIAGLQFKAFIIDDEGDQASLNTKKDKLNEGSATYKAICTMKDYLNDPIYYSVTATPQANIFQPDISKLKPDSIYLIHPANSYTGADCYHLQESNIYQIPEDEDDKLKKKIFAPSLKLAVNHFLISSVLLKRRGISKSDMIVHSFRTVNEHEKLDAIITTYIDQMKDAIKISDPYLKNYLDEIKRCYSSEVFPNNVIQENPWDSIFEDEIKAVIRKTLIAQQNNGNSISDATKKTYHHIIYIGGDLLQRGITFKHLVTTYFTRWAESGNMDTTLQRARWFGYRKSYIDICRVFTPKSIMFEFSNLANIENDLWEQFALVEKKELSINDIVIDAEETSLNPTRKNVVEIRTASFSKKWNNQKIGCFDCEKINHNNQLFNSLVNAHSSEIKTTSAGRTDNQVSARYFYTSDKEILDFINKSEGLFENEPFEKQDLQKVLTNKKICVELLYLDDNDVRTRSFNNQHHISALQQGANSIDIEKITYEGDSSVIADKEAICIQVFKIVPMRDKIPEPDLTQYMYSVHFPKSSIVYRKK